MPVCHRVLHPLGPIRTWNRYLSGKNSYLFYVIALLLSYLTFFPKKMLVKRVELPISMQLEIYTKYKNIVVA